MASEKPGAGQMYALQARKHIATLRRARPGNIIENMWCAAHKGVPGDGKTGGYVFFPTRIVLYSQYRVVPDTLRASVLAKYKMRYLVTNHE